MPGHCVLFLFQKPGQITWQVRGEVQNCPSTPQPHARPVHPESVLHDPYTLAEGCVASTVQNSYDVPWRHCGDILLKLIFILCD